MHGTPAGNDRYGFALLCGDRVQHPQFGAGEIVRVKANGAVSVRADLPADPGNAVYYAWPRDLEQL
jgi:hypothetical protein